MAITLTSTAYSATPRALQKGVYSESINYTTPAGTTCSASAGATCIFGQRVENKTTILGIIGSHTSGAATCPMDIGIDSSTSAFASAKAAGSNAINALSGSVPYFVSLSDDATNQFSTIKYYPAPGTDTTSINLMYTVLLSRDTN